MKDVVVLLPGIMGSALENGGKTIWDVSASAVGRAIFSPGRSLKALALPSDTSTGEGTAATHLLSDAHIIPFLWKIDGYSGLSSFIQDKFKLTPGENFFEFPYDWRLDNRISAARLKASANAWLEKHRYRHPDSRLILIGHSMGGLVARYFLEVLDGWQITKTLITFGTPYRGSIKALDYLANGWRKTFASATLVDLGNLVRSFPSVYQLLPTYECVGRTEDELQSLEKIDGGQIGELDIRRARNGVEFHREIERAIESNRRQEGYGYRILPVVGAYQPTLQSALVTESGIKPLFTYKGRKLLAGDGTVPGFSASPTEFSKARIEMFAACPHASLQNFDPVRVQMRAAVDDIDVSEIKAVAAEAVSLDIQDAFAAGQPVRFRLHYTAVEPAQAILTHLETDTTTECHVAPPASEDGWRSVDAGVIASGTYRIDIAVEDGSPPISDLFTVVADGAND
jgi:pimeloyl-ACP methyl ester carboxylesterase